MHRASSSGACEVKPGHDTSGPAGDARSTSYPGTSSNPFSTSEIDVALEGDGRRESYRLFQAMKRAGLLNAVELSVQFRTLRDMRGVDFIIDEATIRVRREIGSGAFGTVSLCDYMSGGKSVPVAVKRLKNCHFLDEKELKSFTTECTLLKKLSHSSIVEFIGVGAGLHNSTPTLDYSKCFLVTEYCAGGSLRDIFVPEVGIKPDGSLAYIEQDFRKPKGYSFSKALEWLISVAQGLDYLHSASPLIIHRDIKMENILLAKTRSCNLEAKLADFGLSAVTDLRTVAIRESISRMKSEEKSTRGTPLHRFMSAGKVRSYEVDGDLLSLTQQTGTVLYMAPEVMTGDTYTEQADIFSFGVLMFELMTGIPMISRFPVCHNAAMKVHVMRVSEGCRANMPQELPQQISSLIQRLWAQDPESRPRARDLVGELKGLAPQVNLWDKALRRWPFACCKT